MGYALRRVLHKLFGGGFFRIGRFRGAPVLVHWSLPIAALVFGGFTLDPVRWLGFVALVLVHELGHAILVRRIGDEVVAIKLHAFGGTCEWAGYPTRAERALVAWGGVLAQAAVWLVATIVFAILPPVSGVLASVAYVLTTENLRLALFNLIPFPPLDGHEAWKLFGILYRGRSELADYLRARDRDRRERDEENARADRWEKKKKATEETIDELLKDVEEEGRPPKVPSEVQKVLDRIVGKKRGE